MAMPCYYGRSIPVYHGVTLSGINVPIRIGNVTVMPGDLVVGIGRASPSSRAKAEAILDRADETHIHDE